MATKKTASKTSKTADSGISFGSKKKLIKKDKNSAKKIAKRVGVKALLFALLFVFVGAGAGAGAYYAVCRNDCFEIVGAENVSLTLDESYDDEGVKIVAFGKDVKDSVNIETNLNVDADGKYSSTEVGTFYIKYTSSNFKYGKLFKIEKVRLITFVETSEGGE